MTYNTVRHDELFDKESFKLCVWIFGVGGTGGEVARCLVGLGVGQPHSPVHICDPDHFEPHNVPTQLVTQQQGIDCQRKVEAVKENLLRTNPEAVIHTHALKAPHPELPQISGVVFLCLDSMSDRMAIVEELLENNPLVHCVIDIRMDVPGAVVYCFDPDDEFHIGCYFDEWYGDDEAEVMLGCNNEHFAMRSSILGAVCLGMKRFEAFAEHGTAHGIPNCAKMLYETGFYKLETWIKPVE